MATARLSSENLIYVSCLVLLALAIGLIAVFNDSGGLATSSPVTCPDVFVFVYLIMDISYSFKDIAF
ncbi:MAG: hypothetical protein HUJ51_04785 [Eggerthellaceae bacterium]|nr:hypothetical protein [Eggerthellaceae bacterium]